MTIKERIIELLGEVGEISVKELVDRLDVTKQSIHLVMNQLLAEGRVQKLGRVPKTVYRWQEISKLVPQQEWILKNGQFDFLNTHFLLITESGEMLNGIEGFARWCKNRKLPLNKTVDEYIDTLERYLAYKDENGLINGMPKLLNTKEFDAIFLDALYYVDFYAIERFGKTRLGTLLHFAKQGQNKMLMKQLVSATQQTIKLFVQNEHFDAVGFVPPTIRREVQIMKYLEIHLKLPLPKLRLQKLSGLIPVPQKSLQKMDERIRNARNSFAIADTNPYEHVLLIDDAVGSGATLNQIAEKLKHKGIAKKVSAIAIVGSFKGFDVITDV
jgi:dimeric dUTPase (all-alpha-NTP-PPase superfamily)